VGVEGEFEKVAEPAKQTGPFVEGDATSHVSWAANRSETLILSTEVKKTKYGVTHFL